jgi:hypothetical protein
MTNRLFLTAAVVAALGCGGDATAPVGEQPRVISADETKKSIDEEKERHMVRIRELEKKYGKDHPIVKEERLNLGSPEEK